MSDINKDELTGKPTTVLVRGVPVIADGVLRVQPGFGQFLPRTAADPARSGKPVEETTPWLDA